MLLLYCETIIGRVKVMESQKYDKHHLFPANFTLYLLLLSFTRTCPVDVKEAVCSLVFAAPYLEKQQELIKVILRISDIESILKMSKGERNFIEEIRSQISRRMC